MSPTKKSENIQEPEVVEEDLVLDVPELDVLRSVIRKQAMQIADYEVKMARDYLTMGELTKKLLDGE